MHVVGPISISYSHRTAVLTEPEDITYSQNTNGPDRELANWTCTKTHCDTNRPGRGNSTTFVFVLLHKQRWVDMKNICRPRSPWNSRINSHIYYLNYVRLLITMSHFDSYPRWYSVWPISHHNICFTTPLAEKSRTLLFIVIFVYKLRPNKISLSGGSTNHISDYAPW